MKDLRLFSKGGNTYDEIYLGRIKSFGGWCDLTTAQECNPYGARLFKLRYGQPSGDFTFDLDDNIRKEALRRWRNYQARQRRAGKTLPRRNTRGSRSASQDKTATPLPSSAQSGLSVGEP